MGREFLDDALPVDIEREGVRVTGFAGLPTLHRPDPGQQYLFVNGRPVKDKLLIGAVRAAYGDLLPKARYPLLALFVSLAPREVDVNVHPSKAEVRFRDAGRVRSLVAGALRQALEAAGHRATASGGAQTLEALARAPGVASFQSAPGGYAGGPGPGERSTPLRSSRPPNFPQRSGATRGFAEDWQAPLDGLAAPSADARAAAEPAAADLLDRPLGAARAQLHETYIVAQTRTSVVIVDQHAAHERLVYERLKAALANGGVARQVLLIPEIVELDADEAAALAEAAPRVRHARAGARGVRAGRGDGARGAGAARRHRRQGPGARPGARGDGRDAGRGRRQPARAAAGGGVLDHGLPRQRARGAAADGGGDERAAARDGGDARTPASATTAAPPTSSSSSPTSSACSGGGDPTCHPGIRASEYPGPSAKIGPHRYHRGPWAPSRLRPLRSGRDDKLACDCAIVNCAGNDSRGNTLDQSESCRLLARSRPEVGGGSALPSFLYKSMASSTIWHNSSKTCCSSSPWQPPRMSPGALPT